jgi:hypothetical protein
MFTIAGYHCRQGWADRVWTFLNLNRAYSFDGLFNHLYGLFGAIAIVQNYPGTEIEIHQGEAWALKYNAVWSTP